MDGSQRQEFRDLVVAAMAAKGWNITRAGKEAGISTTTMTRIMSAQSVAPYTIGKLRHALGIESLATAQANAGYSEDIEMVRDLVGMHLRDIEPANRAIAARAILKTITETERALEP